MFSTPNRKIGMGLAVLSLAALLGVRATPPVQAVPGDSQVWGRPGHQDVRVNAYGQLLVNTDLLAYRTATHLQVTYTAAQLVTAHTTALPILPAPLATQSYVLDGPVLERFTYGSAAFTGGGAGVIQYHTGAVAATGTVASTVFTSGASSENIVLPVATTPTIGSALEYSIGTANLAAGTGCTLTLDVVYRQN